MIEVSGLKKSFGPTQALRGIDISVGDGIVFALVGPDGAGKTTLLRLLAGILTPDAGSIIISGHDIVKNPESAKQEVGYLSQRFALSPVLTVEENINFFGAMFDVPRNERLARTERLMEFSRLGCIYATALNRYTLPTYSREVRPRGIWLKHLRRLTEETRSSTCSPTASCPIIFIYLFVRKKAGA